MDADIGVPALAAPAFAAVRVALVATGATESTGAAIALASAELSPIKDIQLVDRESIDAILREQKLSLAGLVEAEQMIRIGRLMKADLFAIAHSNTQGQVLGLVVFEPADRSGMAMEPAGGRRFARRHPST
jgi:hypothetical protein